jgi:predicted HTH domain antitoxin
LENVDEILEKSKKHIKIILSNTKNEKSSIAINLFDSLRMFLIEEANNLSNKERTFF